MASGFRVACLNMKPRRSSVPDRNCLCCRKNGNPSHRGFITRNKFYFLILSVSIFVCVFSLAFKHARLGRVLSYLLLCCFILGAMMTTGKNE